MYSKILPFKKNDQKSNPKRICSFARRQGRLTNRQKHALDASWSTMVISYQSQPVDLAVLFNRQAPVILEIGFGMGASLIAMAETHPEINFLGIEVYLPGIGSCLASANDKKINNLRIINHDAVEVLENMVQDASLTIVQLFFPDPWHKTRHNKRRIIQSSFVELVGRKLGPKGILHMATDWKPYAVHMLSVMSSAVYFRNLSSKGDYILRPDSRPFTKFEQRGQKLGHGVWDLMFEKNLNKH